MEPDRDKGLRNDEQLAPTVSSSEFPRKFGQLRQMRDDQAIVVTHHGRATHVLTTVRRYLAMQRRGGADGTESASTASLNELINCLGIGVLLIGYDLRVIAANKVILAQLKWRDGDLSGRNMFDTLPLLRGSLVETCLHRTVASKEPSSAEIRSLFGTDRWVRAEIYPFSSYVAVLFHDFTDDMNSTRLADAHNSLRKAIAEHDGIGYAHLNTRGHIEQTEPTFREILRLPEDRLRNVELADLISVSQRVTFREALDRVLTGEGARTIDSAILSNEGRVVPVRITMAELRGAYGNEGAIVLLTKA